MHQFQIWHHQNLSSFAICELLVKSKSRMDIYLLDLWEMLLIVQKWLESALELIWFWLLFDLSLQAILHPLDDAFLWCHDLWLHLLCQTLEAVSHPAGISQSSHMHCVTAKTTAVDSVVAKDVPVEAVIVPAFEILRIFKIFLEFQNQIWSICVIVDE